MCGLGLSNIGAVMGSWTYGWEYSYADVLRLVLGLGLGTQGVRFRFFSFGCMYPGTFFEKLVSVPEGRADVIG